MTAGQATGAMERSLVLAGCGGLASAGMLTAVLGGSVEGVLFGSFTPLPLLLVGLGLGFAAMPVALIAAVAAMTALNGLVAAITFAAMHVLPAVMMVRQALSRRVVVGADGRAGPTGPWMPPGPILAGLTGFAAFGVAAIAVAIGAGGSVEAAITDAVTAQLALVMPGVTAEQAGAVAGGIAPLILGLGAAAWIVMMAVNGIAAQAIVAARGWNRRPSPQWTALTLPDWLSWFLVGAALVGLVADGDLRYVARNLVVVVAVPFFFLGLAVIHAALARHAARGPLLFGLYLLLGLFFVGVAPFVAVVGVAEQWVGLRRRVAAPTTD